MKSNLKKWKLIEKFKQKESKNKKKNNKISTNPRK